MRSLTLLLALLLLPSLASAQESAAVRAATESVRGLASARSMTPADLADLHATYVAADRRSGSTFVYLAQRHAGVEVFGAVTPVAVTADGRVIVAEGAVRAETNLAARANAPTPQVGAESAAERAIAHVRTLLPVPLPGRLSDDPATDTPAERVYTVLGTPTLVYQPTEAGALRLSWSMELETVAGASETWAVRVDAASGAVLAVDDLVARHTVRRAADAPAASFAPLAAPMAAAVPEATAAAGAYSYRVVPMPFETPNHGPFQLVSNPDDATASPLGWHDTGFTVYDITRGNNGWAYEDRNTTTSGTGSGASAAMTSPMTFDHPFDPALSPQANVNSAITSLFYWGNVIHDVFWHYGFDEPGGNFQFNNFSLGGNGGDFVRLEAQDGSGTNNANFSTPSDGGSGRMQMYEWTAPPVFTILTPPSIAGQPAVEGAAFGATTGSVTGSAIVAISAAGTIGRGCTVADIVNAPDAAGQVLFVQRGDCDFSVKSRNAQAVGAAAIVIYNCTPGSLGCSTSNPGEGLISMGCTAGTSCDDITIPAGFVRESTGQAIITVVGEGTVPQVNLTLDTPSRDSDHDAGIITHEYGHGISTRLVGGPSTSSCLGNAEQMGEGWSDWFGLMLTQQASDTSAKRRGVGTYVEFEPTDGQGIRNAPYSTDFAVNDYTYQDVISSAGGAGPRALSIPHGVGFAWSTMIWDMTWGLIDAHGFDADVYNADGLAGNQIALNLVISGLKLTACNPGFVDGRNGILAADLALYPDAANPGRGLHHDVIWAAFGRRGLGVNASQGSSANANDGMADFSIPPVAQQTRPDGAVVSLAVAGENPFRTTTRMALTLDRAQAVRMEVVDLLGRSVATLHDGALSAATHTMTVSGASLAPGVYLVRAIGEDFVLSERLTVAR